MTGSAVSAGLKGLDKLESYSKKPIERLRMVKDNKKQLRDLLVMYKNDIEEIGEILNTRLHDVGDEDRHIRCRLGEFKGQLEDRLKELQSLKRTVEAEGGKIILSCVRRNREIMDECEGVANKYRDYYETAVRPARERIADAETALEGEKHVETVDDRTAANMSEPDSFVGGSNVPPNPPRLTLDYRSSNTYEGRLKAEILSSLQSASRIVGIMALGLGGVGKTCALQGLANDKDIKDKFPDGILHIQLGNDSVLSDMIMGIAKAVQRTGGRRLARTIRGLRTVEEASEKAGEWFQSHKCLFLVNDIWEVNGIAPQELRKMGMILNDESLLVFSSRSRSFVEGADKKVLFEEREAHGELSRRMLMNHADIGSYSELSSCDRQAVEGILEICQGLPLALGIAGATVQSYSNGGDNTEDAWSNYYIDLKSDEESIVGGSTKHYGRLMQIVEVSLKVLDSNPWSRKTFEEMFRGLCVLPKQQSVGGHVLQKLWNLDDLRSTRKIAELFAEVSIIRMVRRGGNKFSIRVHDLVLDIANTMAVKENEKTVWFRALLNNYVPRNISTSSGAANNPGKGEREVFSPWWNVEDDGFIHNNLCRVLQGADETKQLIWLLERARWVVPRLQKSGINGVEEDLRTGMHVLDKKETDQTEMRSYLKLVGIAARMSWFAVVENAYQAWFQMYGRTVWYAGNCIRTHRFISEIEEHAPRPWVKPSVGFLDEAGGARSEKIRIDRCFRILCLQNGEDVIRILWKDFSGVGYVTEKDKMYGIMKTQMLSSVSVDKHSFGDRANYSSFSNGVGSVSSGELDNQFSSSSDVVSDSGECICGAFSDNEKMLVTGHRNKILLVWDVVDGYRLDKYLECSETVDCIGVSGDGTAVVYGSREGCIGVWDASKQENAGNQFEALDVNGEVRNVDVNFDGKRFVYRSRISRTSVTEVWDRNDGGVIHVWDRDVGGAIAVPPKMENNDVICMSISRNGRRVVTGTWHGTLRTWNVDSTAQAVRTIKGHNRSVNHIALSGAGRTIVSVASSDETVRMWDAGTGVMIRPPLEVGRVDHISISLDGKEIVTTVARDTIRVFKLENMNASLRPDRYTEQVLCVAYCGHGRKLVTGSADGCVRAWDSTNGALIGESLEGHTGAVRCVAVSADGVRIVSASADMTVRVWDAKSGDAVAPPLSLVEGKPLGWIRSVSVNNDGTRVVFSSHCTGVFVWDLDSGVVKIATHETEWWYLWYTRVAMSADGARIAFTPGDNSVTVWDFHTRCAVASRLTGHNRIIESLAFSDDGTRVISGSWDCTVRVWDAVSGEVIADPLVHDSRVVHVQSNADGSRIVSYDQRGYARMWDVGRGQCVMTSSGLGWTSELHRHGLAGFQCRFTPVGATKIVDRNDAHEEQILASTDKQVVRVGAMYFSDMHGSKLWPFCTIVR